MTPKEKAEELKDIFLDYVDDNSKTYLQDFDNARLCALVTAKEIKQQISGYDIIVRPDYEEVHQTHLNYWNQVIEYLENLK